MASRNFSRNQFVLKIDFSCISVSAILEDQNFSIINFDKYSGFSDHTIGIHAALIALSRGASILEKHFTLDKKMHGPDHSCSMTPDELSEINAFVIISWVTLNNPLVTVYLPSHNYAPLFH